MNEKLSKTGESRVVVMAERYTDTDGRDYRLMYDTTTDTMWLATYNGGFHRKIVMPEIEIVRVPEEGD